MKIKYSFLSIMVALFISVYTIKSYSWVPLYTCGNGVYAKWDDSDIPVRWYLNNLGSQSIPDINQVESILQTSYNTWAEVDCSYWDHSYQGTSPNLSTNSNDYVNVFGFVSDWPSYFGDPNSAIAVTTPLYDYNCRIWTADITFNEETFVYVTGFPSAANEVDLQSIATHEMGHTLGLGDLYQCYSGSDRQTMCGMYDGTLGARTLAPDDIDGICTLYPSGTPPQDPCEGVTCPQGQVCIDGNCVDVPECVVCMNCTTNDDCRIAGGQAVCVPLQQGASEGVCIQLCGSNFSCPGDSVCYQVQDEQGNVYNICLNPEINPDGSNICPPDYTCTGCEDTGCGSGELCYDGNCRPDPSSDAGTLCKETDQNCSDCMPGLDICLQLQDQRIVCAPLCSTDSDCGACGKCIQVQFQGDDNVYSICANSDLNSDYSNYCYQGWTCGGDADADADGDADGDVDGDTDTDVDGDTDTDVDGDTDTDSDTDVDGDTDTDSDTDVDGDTDSDSDGDGDTEETASTGCGCRIVN